LVITRPDGIVRYEGDVTPIVEAGRRRAVVDRRRAKRLRNWRI
jgi:hypothetical protein